MVLFIHVEALENYFKNLSFSEYINNLIYIFKI